MPFDIVNRIQDSFGSSDDPETFLDDVDRPDEVTIDNVTNDLTRAIGTGDLSVEKTGFNNESDLLDSIDRVVRDYHEYHSSLDLLDQFQTGWESDAHDTYADAIDKQVADETAKLIGQHADEIASVLAGFERTELVKWISEYGDRYPYFGALIEYIIARETLKEQ